ncbi:MAG: hypothetical protein ACFFAE_10490 [Candidatus Hodarchaeota archaeon]
MTKPNQKNIELLLEKLRKDPDKFERMFAAQYLARYYFLQCKKHLENAVLEDPDPEVIHCIRNLLEDNKFTK